MFEKAVSPFATLLGAKEVTPLIGFVTLAVLVVCTPLALVLFLLPWPDCTRPNVELTTVILAAGVLVTAVVLVVASALLVTTSTLVACGSSAP